MAYLDQAYTTDEAKALLTEAKKVLYDNVPIWVTAAFAIAVLKFFSLNYFIDEKTNSKNFIFSILNWYASTNGL